MKEATYDSLESQLPFSQHQTCPTTEKHTKVKRAKLDKTHNGIQVGTNRMACGAEEAFTQIATS